MYWDLRFKDATLEKQYRAHRALHLREKDAVAFVVFCILQLITLKRKWGIASSGLKGLMIFSALVSLAGPQAMQQFSGLYLRHRCEILSVVKFLQLLLNFTLVLHLGSRVNLPATNYLHLAVFTGLYGRALVLPLVTCFLEVGFRYEVWVTGVAAAVLVRGAPRVCADPVVDQPVARALLSQLAHGLSALTSAFPLPTSLSTLCGVADEDLCVLVQAFAQIVVGAVAPLFVTYHMEKRSRLDFAQGRGRWRGGALYNDAVPDVALKFAVLAVLAWKLCELYGLVFMAA